MLWAGLSYWGGLHDDQNAGKPTAHPLCFSCYLHLPMCYCVLPCIFSIMMPALAADVIRWRIFKHLEQNLEAQNAVLRVLECKLLLSRQTAFDTCLMICIQIIPASNHDVTPKVWGEKQGCIHQCPVSEPGNTQWTSNYSAKFCARGKSILCTPAQ